MSLRLVSVELSNMRSHEYFLFTPGESGITALVGSNGSGKSTVLDSISWVLFGTKPKGVSRASALYREGASWPEDKCWVEVVLIVNGERVRVVKRMVAKSGGVECDVFRGPEDNEMHVAGPASTHAEKWLKQNLMMDQAGFLSAVLVQQKQVDSLMTASGKDRGAVIEKLTGISSLTTALKESRDAFSEVKKELARFDIQDGDLENAVAERDTLADAVSVSRGAVEKIEKDTDTLLENFQEAKEKLSSSELLVEEAEGRTLRKNELTAKLESATEMFTSLMEDREEAKRKLPANTSGMSLRDAENQRDAMKAKLRGIDAQSLSMRSELNEANLRVGSARALIGKTPFSSMDEVEEKISAAEERMKSIDVKDQQLREEIAALESDVRRNRKAITVVSGDSGQCPTCLQEVHDKDGVVAVLQGNIDRLMESMKKSKDTLGAAQEKRLKAENVLAKSVKVKDAFVSLADGKVEVSRLTKELPVLEGKAKVLQGELTSLESLVSSLKNVEDLRAAYEKIRDKAIRVSAAMEKMEKELEEISAYEKSTKLPSAAAMKKMRNDVDKLSEKLSTSRAKEERERGALNLAEERLRNASSKVVELERIAADYANTLERYEISASAVKVVEKFREERIESSVPVIETYASDLLSRFTEGKFIRLKLDKSFNASVVLANGSERPIGLLSGGEMSAAAMSLRIAISLLLSGGSSSGNLIILDEVLVSQDENRSDLMLSTIKEVCKGQVIIVSHNGIAEEIADTTVAL